MTRLTRAALIASAAALAFAALVASASAADPVNVEAAKKEGKVVWYTSTPIEAAQKVVNLFQDSTGIKVEMFRSGGSAIMSRFQQEMQAGRIAVDLVTSSDPAAAQMLAKKGVFVAFRPENFEKVPNEAKDPNGYYIPQRLNMMTHYFRRDKIAEKDQPKTWAELINPKYKGQMVMADPSFTSLQLSVFGMMSRKLGWDYYEKLAKNDVMIVQGGQQVSDMLKRGERLIAVGASDSYATDDRQEGHPIMTVYPEDGTFLIPSPSAVVKGSPNPQAAKLFAAFMLTDAVQKVFPARGSYAARTDIPAPPDSPALGSLRFTAVDYDFLEKEGSRLKKRFSEIFQ